MGGKNKKETLTIKVIRYEDKDTKGTSVTHSNATGDVPEPDVKKA